MRHSLPSTRFLRIAGSCLVALTAALGCEARPHQPSSGAGGSGSGGGGGSLPCPSEPEAMLHLSVTSAEGALPSDATLTISWSAGAEPTVRLDDPTTWGSAGTDNVACTSSGDPMAKLSCELWTSGATRIAVTARGYAPIDETFSPERRDECGGAVPTRISVELTAEPTPSDP